MDVCTSHFRCILKCALDISCSEMEIYITLLENPGIGVDELSKLVSKEKSTTYKALQNLVNKGLVLREYRILRGGGYKYIYKPVAFTDVKKTISKSLDKWINNISKIMSDVERLESRSEFLNALKS